jgi:hypothetical protein
MAMDYLINTCRGLIQGEGVQVKLLMNFPPRLAITLIFIEVTSIFVSPISLYIHRNTEPAHYPSRLIPDMLMIF